MYDLMVDQLNENVEPNTNPYGLKKQRGKRPLKMPKNYDFTVRNVAWDEYKNDFLLRTDAVWEKSKLMDIFYSIYKSKIMYD